MANKEQKLFAEFPPVTTERWEEAIKADLKGADYEKKLVWKTAEGFNVRPYYRAENLEGLRFLGSQCGEFPYVRGTKKNNDWLILQTIEVECPREANARIHALLTKGVESIGLVIGNKEFSADDLDTLLGGVSLRNTELTFSGCATKKVARLFIEKLDRENAGSDDARANFVLDPIVKKLTLKGTMACKSGQCKGFENLASLIGAGAKYKKLRMVAVSGETFHNSGSTIVQELAFTLAAGHEYLVRLTELGVPVEKAARSIRFSMAVSSNYFMEIAKFRAARMLWANIVAQYEPSCECAAKMFAHAVTSRWNMTVYDPYVNMLRGTTEAMSAAIAGVHSIEVLPFDAAYEKPTDFSARIARNVQLLLKEESHFNQVCDAAGGSYYIENLTASIAEQAWSLFKQVEEKGGYITAFEAGFVQDQVEASAAKKNLNIAKRRETLLGTNQFPNFNEVAGDEITEEVVTGKSLVPLRLLVSGARGRSHAEALSRRDGFRADASEGRPERKEPEGFHGDSRSARVRPGPGPVLVQLLRLRRHSRAGQHLFPQRRGRDTRRRRGESRHRRDLRVGRRLRDARPRSLQAARRPGHLRRGRSARLQG